MTRRTSKSEFMQENAYRLIKVWEDNPETGDYMLMAPEEDELAKQYESMGYEICTVYDPSQEGEEDAVEYEFNLASNPFKIGYMVLAQQLS